MINRRKLLAALTGVVGAASGGVSPAQVLAATKNAPMPPPLPAPFPGRMGLDEEESAWIDRLCSDLYDRRLRRYHDSTMPPDIQGKKSWSPVFKYSRAQQRDDELRRAIYILSNDRAGALALVQAILKT